jgi:hypothetical protein
MFGFFPSSALKYKTRLKILVMDNHSTLFKLSAKDEEESFIVTTTGFFQRNSWEENLGKDFTQIAWILAILCGLYGVID